MLKKYFNKSRQQLSLESVNRNQYEENENTNNQKRKLHSSKSFGDEVLRESSTDLHEVDSTELTDNGTAIYENEDLFLYRSHLAMPLLAIIDDPICLSYFVQYLEEKQALALIKFYLDVENFKTVAVAQLEKEKLKNLDVKNVEKTNKFNDNTTNGEENKNVPELSTIYDLSMRKPLTDDEKSQIYADVNKKITIKGRGSQLSLCSTQTDIDDTYDNVPCISAISIVDAMTIYKKYLSTNSRQFIQLPVDILSQISLLLCNHDASETDERLIHVNCFDEAQQWVLEELESKYLQEYLQSKYYCKYCVEFVEGIGNTKHYKINICDILYSEAALFFFMEFLEQQGERECLDFWTQAINYRKSYCSATEQLNDAQADAMILYDKYFSLQADCRLWLSDKVRLHVEQQICGDHVQHCYDLPLRLTADYLQRKYLHNFLISELFSKYITELKTKLFVTQTSFECIHNMPSLEQKHRKTLSDGNISQHNTLLAMDTLRLKSLHATAGVANMNIDARQLTDPQLLWRRRSSRNLKFGSINALGRYERDFESVEAAGVCKNWSLSASGNVLKNVMRKIVKLPEEKLQEEIAWQVAEMIIKDVTNITLKQCTNTTEKKDVGTLSPNSL